MGDTQRRVEVLGDLRTAEAFVVQEQGEHNCNKINVKFLDVHVSFRKTFLFRKKKQERTEGKKVIYSILDLLLEVLF